MADWLDRIITNRSDTIAVVERHIGAEPHCITYRELSDRVGELVRIIQSVSPSAGPRCAIVCGNTTDFVVADLATMALGSTQVPVPLAFSKEQAEHLMGASEIILVDSYGRERLGQWSADLKGTIVSVDTPLDLDIANQSTRKPLSDNFTKIVHTSGTTSAPKGVITRHTSITNQIHSLQQRFPENYWEKYTSLVPLSLLIEQVCAIYLTLSAGGEVHLLPGEKLFGDPGHNPEILIQELADSNASIVQVPPAAVEELHRRICGVGHHSDRLSHVPQTILAGGAPVDPRLLAELEPHTNIFAGYGLSENASVVALNYPGHNKIGTVGPALPHVEIMVGDNEELLVRSTSMFDGYEDGSADPTQYDMDPDGWLHTGDRCMIDADGYLTVTGRLKNVIITSSGRNVSAEFIESLFRTVAEVRNVAVVGDGMERIVAYVLVANGCADTARQKLSSMAQDRLSDVERPSVFDIHETNPELEGSLFTITGRPRREAIMKSLRTRNVI